MYKRKRQFRPGLIALILLVLTVATIGVTTAKYVHQRNLPGQVTFTARLADKLELAESRADRLDNGEYTLASDETVSENTYILLPGTDIPKDPKITVTGKTPIEAYLFVKVTDETNEAITWQADAAHWVQVTGVHIADNEKLFVYKDKLTDQNCPTDPIPVLAGSRVTVSQHLTEKDTPALDELTFHAFLYEAIETDGVYATPAEVYNTYNPAA